MSIKRRLKRVKHSFYDYISFTQGEFRGTVLLLSIVIFLVGVRWLLPFFDFSKYNNVNAVVIENPDSLIAITNKLLEEKRRAAPAADKEEGINIPELEIEHSRFAFDPNTVSFPDMLKLGFDPKVASNVVKYRDKGGKFKRATDLYKIYGVDQELVSALIPYVVLPESNAAAPVQEPRVATEYEAAGERGTYHAAKPVEKTRTVVDLNKADSAALVEVNGIGPTFASRILKFRDRLGGFVSKEQLKDVYGLTPEHYETIAPHVTVDPNAVRKININNATLEELKSHVYFKYNVAKAVVAYREQHGPFKSKDELKEVALVEDTFYKKIEPYVALE